MHSTHSTAQHAESMYSIVQAIRRAHFKSVPSCCIADDRLAPEHAPINQSHPHLQTEIAFNLRFVFLGMCCSCVRCREGQAGNWEEVDNIE